MPITYLRLQALRVRAREGGERRKTGDRRGRQSHAVLRRIGVAGTLGGRMAAGWLLSPPFLWVRRRGGLGTRVGGGQRNHGRQGPEFSRGPRGGNAGSWSKTLRGFRPPKRSTPSHPAPPLGGSHPRPPPSAKSTGAQGPPRRTESTPPHPMWHQLPAVPLAPGPPRREARPTCCWEGGGGTDPAAAPRT